MDLGQTNVREATAGTELQLGQESDGLEFLGGFYEDGVKLLL